jgi:PII-like signaling protein
MQATVKAAIISGCFELLGVSGTVLVAIAGFRENRRISGESAENLATK